MNEQSCNSQIGKMLGPRLIGTAGCVQRIGKQEKAVSERRFGQQHTRLSPAVALTAEKDSSGDDLSERGNCVAQSLAITRGVAGAGRAEAPHLTEGQINSQNCQSGASKSFRKRDQQRHLRISARAVGQDKTASSGRRGPMQVAENGGIA